MSYEGNLSVYPAVHENALKILKKRKYLHEIAGTIESVDQMFWRVATVVSSIEKDQDLYRNKFFEMMRSLRFMPNTPTLMNAGKPGMGQMLAACFVLPIGDSMPEIMDAMKWQAVVQSYGGGTGFGFGSIRERGALIRGTGIASGPIPVIKSMNYLMSNFIEQGGARDGANMGVLPDTHMDLEEFIHFKEVDGSCKSFNVSIGASDAFMQACKDGDLWELKSVVSGNTKIIDAGELFESIATQAYRTGDPGFAFLDTINRFNPTPQLGRMEATNPCGEIPLLPFEACTLGHLNLAKYFICFDKFKPLADWRKQFNWELFYEDIALGIRFLDNVVDVNAYPIEQIAKMHRDTNRKIGLGVMGLADLLILMGIQYNSDKAIEIATEIAAQFRFHADLTSHKLGVERGSFGSFQGSALREGWMAMRNACRTCVAPTGSTAIFAGCSTGIEPIFGLVLERNQAGMIMQEVHPLLDEVLKSLSDDQRTEVVDFICTNKSIQGAPHISPSIKALFVQANDIDYTWHIKMQAAWQRYIDQAISKTINLGNSATVEDVKSAYIMAWEMGAKGCTVYRDGSRSGQALSVPMTNIITIAPHEMCPECKSKLTIAEGCETCQNCGYSACSWKAS
jgi:ribonucleoside-diphosphate reductase alpha chain